MKNLKTELTEEWYILSNRNHGSIVNTSKGLYYSGTLNIETFDNYEGYELRCEELGIEIFKYEL